jgi:ectoine hydroxylase-related dioxygenase (phytanoyl-CoA dioxygenase family)
MKPIHLTDEQISFFHQNGFLSLPEPITTDEELATMRVAYDRIFAEKAGRDEGNQFDLGGSDDDKDKASLPQILNPAKYAPELREGVFLDNANLIAKQLLGDTVSVGVAHAIYKPAGQGAPTPWHQDEAYWDPQYEYCSISLWMPLQEATEENGCLWFMPGSQNWDIQTHQSIGGDVRVHGLEMMDLSVIQDPVCCPLQPGGITIHLNRTAHYAGANHSGVPRRALILGGGLPNKPYPTPRRFPWNEVKDTAREQRARAAQSK